MSGTIFEKLEAAAFANPFGEERVKLDRQILGAPEHVSWDDMQEPLFEALAENIQAVKNIREVVAARDEDSVARSVAVSVLFYVFYEVQEKFDALIEEQIAAGDVSCRAPFALECMERLMGYGFSREDACRYVGIYYQIRRAYYFISNGLVGSSDCMRILRAQLWGNIFTHDISWYEQGLWNRMEDFSTLLLGETGTGKGAAAAAIGRSGFIPFNPRTQTFAESFTRAFVSINLSQYPEALIESELFGHRKGAFTGAIETHEGIFARCSPYGSIFLDEIGDVAVPIQIKLLQVLQARTYSPVGSHETRRFEGRVIAATNQPLGELRKAGQFRDDFYYRLCSDLIIVPPLRTRIRESAAELDSLCTHIMTRICGDATRLPIVDLLKSQCGKHYGWPGNVRELEQAIRRIMLTGVYEGDRSRADSETDSFARGFEAGEMTAKELVATYCSHLYEAHGNYGEVARRTGLDWRTVKKHIEST